MSAITKERIELFIKNPLDNGLTRGEQMELARIALASLEAEAVATFYKSECGNVFNTLDSWLPVEGVNNLYAAPQLPQQAVVSEKMIDTFEAEFRRAFDVSAGVEQLIEIGYQGENFSLSIRDAATWWKLGRAAMFHGVEPATDNTNQQFESLSRGDK